MIRNTICRKQGRTAEPPALFKGWSRSNCNHYNNGVALVARRANALHGDVALPKLHQAWLRPSHQKIPIFDLLQFDYHCAGGCPCSRLALRPPTYIAADAARVAYKIPNLMREAHKTFYRTRRPALKHWPISRREIPHDQHSH